MDIIENILKERDIIVASVKADWEKAEERKKVALKKLREKYMQMSRTNSNWAYFVRHENAYTDDDMKIVAVDCPFCEGAKKMRQYNDDIVCRFENLVDCPLCEGYGTAWFKYGVFEIYYGRGTRGG